MEKLSKAKRILKVLLPVVVLVALIWIFIDYTSEIRFPECLLLSQLKDPELNNELVSVLRMSHSTYQDSNFLAATSRHRKALKVAFDRTAEYPNFVMGIVGWMPKDSADKRSITFEYWFDTTTRVDSIDFHRICCTLPHSGYIYAIPQPKDSKGKMLLSAAHPEGEADLHVFNLLLELPATSDSSSATDSVRCSLFVYYPMENIPGYGANFIFACIVLVILFALFRGSQCVQQKYFRYFRLAMMFLTGIYLCFLLPGILQSFHISWLAARSVSNLLLFLLPDNAAFLLAGLFMFIGEEKRVGKWWIIAAFAVHYLTVAPELFQNVQILYGSGSFFFPPFKLLRELPPQMYALVVLCVIGMGVYRRGMARAKSLKQGHSPIFEYFTVTLSVVFVLYGLCQPLYSIRGEIVFFEIVLGAKFLAFSGIILFLYLVDIALFTYLERVDETLEAETKQIRKKYQSISESTIKIWPEPIVVFDNQGEILFLSDSAKEQLGLETTPKSLKEILADEKEWDFVSHLISSGSTCEGFLLCLKDAQGERVSYVASFMPGEKITENEMWYFLILNPFDEFVFETFVRSIHTHSLKGDVITVRNWMNQILSRLKEDYGVDAEELKRDPKVTKLQNLLSSLIDRLKAKEPGKEETKRFFQQPNVTDLKEIFEELSVIQDKGHFDCIKIALPELSHPILVRAKEEIAKEIFKELLRNASQKFTRKEPGEVTITKEESKHQVRILVQDSGKPIPTEALEKLADLSLATFQYGRKGIPYIKSNMILFGGDLNWENRSMDRDGKKTFVPTLIVTFWKTKEV